MDEPKVPDKPARYDIVHTVQIRDRQDGGHLYITRTTPIHANDFVGVAEALNRIQAVADQLNEEL
jgi:hypothetical protein